jgi:glyoxylase-like metal-dependent hydrolase (beta-lactamase superfamily II)
VILPIPGTRAAHAYLVQQPDGLVAIDAGYIGSDGAILRFIRSRGFRPEDLKWVVVTHHHVDHAGSAARLCAQTGAQLAIHAADAPYLASGRPKELMTLWGAIERLPARLARLLLTVGGPIGRRLEDGDVLHGLRVIHAPGHTPGSICLYSESESAVFVGDVLNNERGLRRPPWNVNHNHREAQLAARRLRGLSYERAFFGHGAPIEREASRAISRYVDQLAAS